MSHFRWLLAHLSRLGWSIGDVWLGGNDIAVESTWRNLDGSAFDFAYWGGGQPNNDGGWQNCASFSSMFRYEWNDGPCGDAKFSLLKWVGDSANADDGKCLLILFECTSKVCLKVHTIRIF
jgi:hypothetical protein